MNIFGYIDPSVMTYAIQAGAGILIAVGAFVGLYFRKAKRRLARSLAWMKTEKKKLNLTRLK